MDARVVAEVEAAHDLSEPWQLSTRCQHGLILPAETAPVTVELRLGSVVVIETAGGTEVLSKPHAAPPALFAAYLLQAAMTTAHHPHCVAVHADRARTLRVVIMATPTRIEPPAARCLELTVTLVVAAARARHVPRSCPLGRHMHL